MLDRAAVFRSRELCSECGDTFTDLRSDLCSHSSSNSTPYGCNSSTNGTSYYGDANSRPNNRRSNDDGSTHDTYSAPDPGVGSGIQLSLLLSIGHELSNQSLLDMRYLCLSQPRDSHIDVRRIWLMQR